MKSTSRISLTLLTLVIGCGLLTACKTTSISGIDKSVCSIFPPITYSKTDTPETRLNVRKHNAAFDSYCRGKS